MRRILWGSLSRRKGRVVVSVCAIALGASLIVAAVNLRQEIGGALGKGLRNYGSNLLLVPGRGSGPFLKEQALLVLEDERLRGRVIAYAPFLYRLAEARGRSVVVGGTDLDAVRKMSPWWQVDGKWPGREEEALVGFNAASKLGLSLGDRFSVRYGTSELGFSVAGLLRTGGAEEHQLFVSLKRFQRLTMLEGLLTSVLISSRPDPDLEATVAFLRQAWPQAEGRTVLQVARAEQSLLSRLEVFLTLVGLLILSASAVSVFSTATRAALERKVEMALMRALGAGQRKVAAIFAFEALGVGLMGGLLGCAMGLLLSEAISLSVFASFIAPNFLSLATGLGVGLGVAVFSTLSVVRRVSASEPAVVLRGE